MKTPDDFPIPVTLGQAANATQPWYAEPQEPVAGIGDIVLVASGKGGVGKSTVTVNLACAMERLGNVLPPEAGLVWKGPLVAQALVQMFRELAWPELDILLVDMPPGTGDVALTILEQIPLSGALLVTTPQRLSTVDAARGVALLHDLDIPVFGLIENMASYVCPCCGEAQPLFPEGAAEDLAVRKHVRYLGGLPLDPEGQACADRGEPLVVARPEGAVAAAFASLAQEVESALQRERAFRRRDADAQARAEHEMFWENLLDD
ncbi:MAG: P-loop NTPase [Candidatus Thiodiazotropha sp.]